MIDETLVLCFYPVKPIYFCSPRFPILKIYQLDIIIGNDRSQVITLFKLGNIERFVIQTNGTGKTFNNLCPILHVGQISCKETILLLFDSKIKAFVFYQFGGLVYFTIPTLHTSPFS